MPNEQKQYCVHLPDNTYLKCDVLTLHKTLIKMAPIETALVGLLYENFHAKYYFITHTTQQILLTPVDALTNIVQKSISPLPTLNPNSIPFKLPLQLPLLDDYIRLFKQWHTPGCNLLVTETDRIIFTLLQRHDLLHPLHWKWLHENISAKKALVLLAQHNGFHKDVGWWVFSIQNNQERLSALNTVLILASRKLLDEFNLYLKQKTHHAIIGMRAYCRYAITQLIELAYLEDQHIITQQIIARIIQHNNPSLLLEVCRRLGVKQGLIADERQQVHTHPLVEIIIPTYSLNTTAQRVVGTEKAPATCFYDSFFGSFTVSIGPQSETQSSAPVPID